VIDSHFLSNTQSKSKWDKEIELDHQKVIYVRASTSD